jgi:hypothetical protein
MELLDALVKYMFNPKRIPVSRAAWILRRMACRCGLVISHDCTANCDFGSLVFVKK